MKTRMMLATLALCFTGVMCFAADDPHMGTWKLNEAKSKIAAGSPKNSTVVYAAEGDNVKITVDGTDADAKPMHNEWTGKFDGRTIRSLAIRPRTCGFTKRSMRIRWSSR